MVLVNPGILLAVWRELSWSGRLTFLALAITVAGCNEWQHNCGARSGAGDSSLIPDRIAVEHSAGLAQARRDLAKAGDNGRDVLPQFVVEQALSTEPPSLLDLTTSDRKVRYAVARLWLDAGTLIRFEPATARTSALTTCFSWIHEVGVHAKSPEVEKMILREIGEMDQLRAAYPHMPRAEIACRWIVCADFRKPVPTTLLDDLFFRESFDRGYMEGSFAPWEAVGKTAAPPPK